MTFVEIEAEPGRLNVSALDKLFDDSALQKRALAVVLPAICSEADLIQLLNRLPQGSHRWRLVRRHAEDERVVHVGLQWTTSTGEHSEAMGFGPFIAMPVPRRGPYVALALWPGSHDNHLREVPLKMMKRVSFVDTAHKMIEEKYDAAWKASEEDVRALLEDPPRYYRTTFVLPYLLADQVHWS